MQGDTQSIAQSKDEASYSRSQGIILAENHSGQGNKASPIRHTRVEDARNTQGQVRACQAREEPTAEDAHITQQLHIHTGSVCRLWMLTHRSNT